MGERGATASLFLLSLRCGNEQLGLGRPSQCDLTLAVCSAFQSGTILHSVAPSNEALCYVFVMSQRAPEKPLAGEEGKFCKSLSSTLFRGAMLV